MRKSLLRPSGKRRILRSVVLMAGFFCASLGCNPEPPPLSGAPVNEQRGSLLGAQGEKTIAGVQTVLNSYSRLTQDAHKGDTTISVADVSALGESPGNLKIGDLIMIIQMQGALMDTTSAFALNNGVGSGYGSVLNFNNAGRYEIASVLSFDVAQKTITLDFSQACGGLKNDYDAVGKAQVVWVPQYTALNIIAGGVLSAKRWDAGSGTGGVVAVYVQGKTTVSSTSKIDVSGSGFQGGSTDNDNQSQATGKYTANFPLRSADPRDGGEHGEGIAGNSADYDAQNGRYGRGAPANGGGGGGTHHGGGGGGANGDKNSPSSGSNWSGQGVMVASSNAFLQAWKLDDAVINGNGGELFKSAGGGRGGYTTSAPVLLGPANPTSNGPGDPIWLSDRRQDAGGHGGHPLASSPKNTLFLGGGGGAGDGDNGIAGAGGAGGGLIYLVTGGLEGAGQIVADGEDGHDASAPLSGIGDGAGGGGGGGSVVILSGQAFQNSLTVNARGGNGGSQVELALLVTNADGPGGGGGGGYIATFAPQGTSAAQSILGGSAGTTNSPPQASFAVNGASNGAEGQALDSLIYADAPSLPVCVPSNLSTQVLFTRGTLNPGNTIQLTATIANSGPEPANTAALFDSLPSGLSASDISWSCFGNNANCPAPSGTGSITGSASPLITALPAGGVLTYVLSIKIPAGFATNLDYQLSALMPPGFNDPNLADNTASVSLALGSSTPADLGVFISSTPNPASPGATIDYSITVANFGPGTADGVSFAYSLPAGATLQKVDLATSPGWACMTATAATAVNCTYTPPNAAIGVPPNAALPDVHIFVLPAQGASNALASVALSMLLGAKDDNPSNDTASSDTPIGDFPPADFNIGLNSTPNPASPGAAIGYEIRVANSGPTTATGAIVTFNVPFGNTVLSFDTAANHWSCSAFVNRVTCKSNVGSISTGFLPAILISVQPGAAASSLSATAHVDGLGAQDRNTANNTAVEVTPIGDAPTVDLQLTVSTTPNPARQDIPVVYTLSLVNQGSGAATGAVLTFDIPQDGSVFRIDAPARWNCAPVNQQVSCWYNGNIASGASVNAVKIAILAMADATRFVSKASVLPKGATDSNLANNVVDTTVELGSFQLTGAGIACQMQVGRPPGFGYAFAAALLGILLRRRRRC